MRTWKYDDTTRICQQGHKTPVESQVEPVVEPSRDNGLLYAAVAAGGVTAILVEIVWHLL